MKLPLIVSSKECTLAYSAHAVFDTSCPFYANMSFKMLKTGLSYVEYVKFWCESDIFKTFLFNLLDVALQSQTKIVLMLCTAV